MSTVRLNDVWRTVGDEIGFFTNETFAKVPATPGVYAWFYPLRIVTNDLSSFMNEVDLVLNYDCDTRGVPIRDHPMSFGWQYLQMTGELKTKPIDLTTFQSIWDDALKIESSFNELRKIIMRSSIFLPPLYVGKTNNLRNRCKQHINGTGGNNFNSRFEEYAKKTNSTAKRVSDLLFVSIKISNEEDILSRYEELVEAMLKYLAKPRYSKL
jgi:hypothetical protein